MKQFANFSNILFRKGLNEYLSTMFPTVKIEKRTEQFLNLLLLNYLEKLVKNCALLIRHRGGKIIQRKDINFFIYLQKGGNFPNLKFFDKKIFKKKK